MATRSLCVVPQPKRLVWGEGAFRLDAQTSITLLPGAGDAERFAARTLQEEIARATGLVLPIVITARPVRLDKIILLVSDMAAGAAFLGQPLPWDGDLAERGEQAYGLSLSAERVVAGGRGATALHYAVQTLRQMARTEGVTWPALQIVDWPSLPYRGVMMDVSRGKVHTLETLQWVVDQLSLMKANVLQLYTEHTFVFPHHPRIGQGCSSLSGDDMLALDAYARPRGVELMPNLQSFGHMAHILAMPEYRHLAECAACWSICPQDEGTYALFDDLYADLLPSFNSKTLNIDCDETYDLGQGRSREATDARGKGQVYLEHILRLHVLARKYGCRIQLWGDILLHHPELVSSLPDDVTLLDWHYEAAEDYPSVRIFAESGRPFWVCPGTSSWNTLFPRIENSNGNIRTLARLAVAHGGTGLLNTDWGDYGHYQPIGQSIYGYAYGCEQAWTGGTTEDAAFDPRFGRLCFGSGGEAVAETMRALARLNVLPGMARRNASNSIYSLLDDPLAGEITAQLPGDTLETILSVCLDAERALRAAIAGSSDVSTLREMIYSVRMMAYAARKVRASQGVRADLDAIARGRSGALSILCQARETMRAMDAEFVPLTEEFRQLWLVRARHAEMDITLGHFARMRGRLALAGGWLSEQIAEIEAGKTPNYDLSAYTAEARSYEVLGQGFWRHMREAGVMPG